jgi:hypothetical protein
MRRRTGKASSGVSAVRRSTINNSHIYNLSHISHHLQFTHERKQGQGRHGLEKRQESRWLRGETRELRAQTRELRAQSHALREACLREKRAQACVREKRAIK